MRIRSIDFRLLVFIFQNLIPRRMADETTKEEWDGGDWGMESLEFTDEPIANTAEWANYLHTLGDEYEEYPARIKSLQEWVAPSDRDLRKDPPDWYPLAPNEDPYLTVLYRKDETGRSAVHKFYFPNDPQPKGSQIAPGTACGGAMLSPRHVFTSCGCLLTLITKLYNIQNPLPHGFATYDIHDHFNESATIYVMHTVTDFSPDFKHEIDLDQTKWFQKNSLNCKDTLLELGDRGKRSHYELETKLVWINAQPVIVPFKPEIIPNYFRYFPKWPPVTINAITDQNYAQRVDLISIGMRLTKPGRLQFFSSISASITEMRHCHERTIVCNETKIKINALNACYCPLKPGAPKLLGGVIGWPMVQKGFLVGITASERHPADGTVLTIAMHGWTNSLIEEYVSKKVLEDQNTPEPAYRAKELERKYQIYDYEAFKWRSVARPESKATTNAPTVIMFSITILFWINVASNIEIFWI